MSRQPDIPRRPQCVHHNFAGRLGLIMAGPGERCGSSAGTRYGHGRIDLAHGHTVCEANHARCRDCQSGCPKSAADGRLISVKDNICTRDLPTTCGSGILDRFSSPFNATVVEQLEAAGAIVAGKTNLDEFGMGSHSIHSRFGPVKSARCDAAGEALSAGGSSGGSAVAVATDQCYACVLSPIAAVWPDGP